MSKLDRIRFGNYHKRRLFVVMAVLLVLVLIAMSILLLIGTFGDRSELVRVKLSNDIREEYNSGLGVNLDFIPSVNRVRDASFENEFSYSSYDIAGSSTYELYFNPANVVPVQSGSSIKVMSVDADERISCVYEGVVADFENLGFAEGEEVGDSSVISDVNAIIKTVVFNNTVTVLLSDGRVVTNLLTENDSSFLDIDGEVVDIIVKDGIYAVTKDGEFYLSSNGEDYSLIASYEGEVSPVKLLKSDSAIVALCEDSSVLVLSGNSITSYELIQDATIAIASSNSNCSIFISDDNRIWATTNFLVANELNDVLIPDAIVADVVASGDVFYVIYDDGQIQTLSINGSSVESKIMDSQVQGGLLKAIPYGDGIIVVNKSKLAVLINSDIGYKTLSDDGMSINNVFESSSDRVLYISGDKLYNTQLLSGIITLDPITTDQISSGDVCIIGTYKSPLVLSDVDNNGWNLSDESGIWDVYGEGTLANIVPTDDKKMGEFCCRLVGNTDNYHMLSQELVGASEDNFEDDTFYRMELKLKGEDIYSDVDVWLSIDGEAIEGFNISSVGDNFSSHSYVFVIPSSKIGDSPIRFNVGFNGTGTLYVDNIYVGEDKHNTPVVDESFIDSVKDAKPQFVRLNNLKLGCSGYNETEFYGSNYLSSSSVINGNKVSSCKSLEQSLRLVRDASSNPWIVVSANASTDDINHLLEYLCGFDSSEYSQIRVSNGTSLPWSQQFDEFYIEITDTDNILSNDLQRGAYVDYVIRMVEQSDYYVDIRNKIHFVDGMTYDYETILSGADFHAMTLDINIIQSDELTTKDQILEAYKNASSVAPRIATHSNISGEFLSSVTINSEIELNASDIINCIYNENSMFVNRVMITMYDSGIPVGKDSSVNGLNQKVTTKVLGDLSDIGSANYCHFELGDPPSTNATDTAEQFKGNTTVICLDNGTDKFIIVTNNSTTAQQFLVETKGGISVDKYYRFNASGSSINSNRWGADKKRQVIQPGQFIIIKCN